MIPAGDVGGTKTLRALFEIRDNKLVEQKSKKFAGNDYESLETILTDLLNGVKNKIE